MVSPSAVQWQRHMKPADFAVLLRTAERHLVTADPRFDDIVKRAGPCQLVRASRFRPFDSLLSAITHQQLSGKAAQTILGRVKARLADGAFPSPEQVKAARADTLRRCGLSRAKVLAVKDLAAKTLDGTVPSARLLHRLDDEAIIERVTTVRGVGQWTVEMMLMFRLGRLDVLPVDDLGVRKGYAQLAGLASVTPRQLAAAAEPWRPFRSVASWYLWRMLDS